MKEMDKEIPLEILKSINSTFNLSSEKLPLKSDIDGYLDLDFNNISRLFLSYKIRDEYLKYSFIAYNHELLISLRKFCESKNMKIVHELCCGTGWFSHWMLKYGIPIKKSIDNKTWKRYKEEDSFLPIVEKDDAIDFAFKNGSADMFIVSWPYMDDVCNQIWKNMKPDQYLLYIGESQCGCTANDAFFESTDEFEIESDKQFNKIVDSFIAFSGIHDRPRLYLKK